MKRYFNEPGARRIDDLFESTEQLASSTLGYVEVTSAISRRWHRTSSTDLARAQLVIDWSGLIQVPLTAELMERAAVLARRFRLRGADAVHLSAADLLRSQSKDSGGPMVLLSSDQEMLRAATELTIRIEDPATALPP